MPLINQAIPNLIGGVSQQPDVARFEGQCELQENALSSVVNGLSKRPHCKRIANILDFAIGEDSFVYFINRSATEKYIVIHNGTTLRIFNANTGVQCSLAVSGGAASSTGYTFSNTATPYLDTSNPKENLKALTIGDNTFILNKNEETATKTDRSAVLPKEAFAFIKQGNFDKKYGVEVTSDFAGTAGIQAVVQCVMEVFTHSGRKYFRVKSASATTAGKYYIPSDASITLSTSQVGSGGHGIQKYHQWSVPTFNISVNATTGAISSIEVVNAGRFNRLYASTSASNGDTHTVTATISAPTGQAFYEDLGDITTKTAVITSGSDSSDPSYADTTVIMDTLIDDTSSGMAAADNSFDIIPDTDSHVKVTQGNNLAILSRETVASTNIDGVDFDIAAIDGLGGQGIGVGYKKTSSISDLPLYCKNGFKIEIVGDADTNKDNYWVEFQTTNNRTIGDGTWVETICPNTLTDIEPTSMPYVLKLTSENTFTLDVMSLAKRNVGDEETNPMPSFIGKKLANIFLFRNRLGFITEDNVVMSEAGLGVVEGDEVKYNFFKTTVTTSLDSDPIDVTVSTGKVTNLKETVGFQENLILFSKNSQFVLRGGDLLTPNTVSIAPITNFEFDQNITPLAIGSYIYFPFKRGNFSGIREFTVNSTTDNYDANEITDHVPSYLPSDVETMSGSTTEDVIIFHAPSTPKVLYIYKYFWNGNQKILSSWSKFTLPFEVRGYEIMEGVLYMIGVMNEGNSSHDGTYLATMNLQTDERSNTYSVDNVYLDFPKQHTGTNHSGISLGFTPEATDLISVMDADGNFLAINANGDTQVTAGTGRTTVDLHASHSGTIFTGVQYTMKYQFSEQVFKQPAGNSKAPAGFTKAQIRNCNLFFNNAQKFDVKITPDLRSEQTYTFTPSSTSLEQGDFRFPVFTDAEDTVILIENKNGTPAQFTSAEFEMFVHERSRRFG